MQGHFGTDVLERLGAGDGGRSLMIAPPSTNRSKGMLELWTLASVASAFEPKDRYGAWGRTGKFSSIESV